MSGKPIARLSLIFLAGFGVFAGARLSIDHLQHGETCPMLGPIPACIIVFLGYLSVGLAALFVTKSVAKRMFYIGWTPVFLLALVGVFLELTQGDICPPGGMGIPQCFYSFGMALACLLLFKSVQRSKNANL